jgi:hypothetical protein
VRQGAIESAALLPSFEQGAAHFSRLSGVPMSDTTLHELMQTYGRRQVVHEAAAAHVAASAPERGVPGPGPHGPPPPAQVALSQDGTTILTYDGWKEVKVSSISLFDVCAATEPGKPTAVRLTQHSYCAGLWAHDTVNEHFWWDMVRRRADRSPCQVAVADAAPWIWENIALTVPKAHELIDWWHVVDYFWRLAKAVFGEGTQEAAVWMATTKASLWGGALDQVRRAVGDLQPTSDAGKTAVRCALAYLTEHDKRLRYPAFRVAGYPVGSGSVESACKTLVGGRMKHGGQRWKVAGANAVLAVRSALLSDRWYDAWSCIYWPQAESPTTS